METNCWKLIDRTKITHRERGRKREKMCVGIGREESVERRGNMNGKMTLLRACIGIVILRESTSTYTRKAFMVCLRFYANRLEHEIVRCGVCTMIEREWKQCSGSGVLRMGE